MSDKITTLKDKILSEMTVDYANTLEKNFSHTKEFLRITSTGTVDLLKKDEFTGLEKILLYLIGKVYAKEAGLTSSEFVSNKELCEELGLKIGSVLPWLKTLRDEGKVESKDSKHAIKVNLIENFLKDLNTKVKKNG